MSRFLCLSPRRFLFRPEDFVGFISTHMYGFGEKIPRYALALYDSVLSVEEYMKYGKLKP